MKYARVSSVIAIALVFVFASGASTQDELKPQTAKDIFLGGLESFKQQAIYRFELTATFQSGSMPPVKLQVGGFFQTPDFFYLKAEGLGGTTPVEGYYKGEKGAVKDDFKRKWVPAEQATMPLARHRMRRPDELLDKLLPYAETATLGEPDKRGETTCQVVNFALPPDALSPLLRALDVSIGSVQCDPARTKTTSKCWVAKDAGLPLELVISLETSIITPEGEVPDESGDEPNDKSGGETGTPPEKPADEPATDEPGGEEEPPVAIDLTITISTRFFDFGKKIEVELPPEVKELLGIDTKAEECH